VASGDNLKTAKALGLDAPLTLLALTDGGNGFDWISRTDSGRGSPPTY
jgi:hypothetical protein